jgi:signal transduction histidine kinase
VRSGTSNGASGPTPVAGSASPSPTRSVAVGLDAPGPSTGPPPTPGPCAGPPPAVARAPDDAGPGLRQPARVGILRNRGAAARRGVFAVLALAVLGLPVAALGVLVAGRVTVANHEALGALAELASMAFLVSGALLAVRWRVFGDSSVRGFVAAVVVLGVAAVPSVSLAAAWAGSGSTRAATAGFVAAIAAAALAVGASRRSTDATDVRVVRASAGLALVSGVASAAVVAAHLGRSDSPWSLLPVAQLCAGAVGVCALVVGDFGRSLRSLVLDDAAAQRRREEAEAELALLRRVHRGQEHDINSTLAAVSGALLVLQHQRSQLSAEQVDHLTGATREQVQWLRTLLVGADDAGRGVYDVTKILGVAVALRQGQPQTVICAATPGLWARGRADRLAMVVNNLLANAAVHAPAASVVVWAGPGRGSRAGMVEVVVSDDGPGITGDLTHPLERGWRGPRSSGVPGSGLGLYQCRQLIECEGGEILLTPTDVAAPEGRCGLSVHLWLPAAGPDSRADAGAFPAPEPASEASPDATSAT